MCRHLAYLGPPVTIASVVLEPPHGLLHQSYAPSDMRGGGTINADGFGVAWYPDSDGPAVRYRSSAPLWSDTSFPAIAGSIRSTAIVGAVRSATTGMPVTVEAAAPFQDGRWLFSHNGMVRGWPESMRHHAEALPAVELLRLDALTDSALLWATVRGGLRAGIPAADVITGALQITEEQAPGSRLNLLLTDGHTVWATAWYHALSVRHINADSGAAVVVASEPLDHEPGWQEVPDRHLVVATPGNVAIRPIDPTGHS